MLMYCIVLNCCYFLVLCGVCLHTAVHAVALARQGFEQGSKLVYWANSIRGEGVQWYHVLFKIAGLFTKWDVYFHIIIAAGFEEEECTSFVSVSLQWWPSPLQHFDHLWYTTQPFCCYPNDEKCYLLLNAFNPVKSIIVGIAPYTHWKSTLV